MASSAGRAGFSDEINFPQWDNSGTFPHAFGALFEILGLESNAPDEQLKARAHRRVRNWPAKIEFY
jgi:hypothetical protein